MKNLKNLLTLAALLAGASSAWAASHTASPAVADDAKNQPAAGAATAMTEGEIRKIDLDNKKITIKHGEIKNLDMPSMTMVFQVKDPAMLEKVKAGDKVRFRADKANGAMVVTDMQPAQ